MNKILYTLCLAISLAQGRILSSARSLMLTKPMKQIEFTVSGGREFRVTFEEIDDVPKQIQGVEAKVELLARGRPEAPFKMDEFVNAVRDAAVAAGLDLAAFDDALPRLMVPEIQWVKCFTAKDNHRFPVQNFRNHVSEIAGRFTEDGHAYRLRAVFLPITEEKWQNFDFRGPQGDQWYINDRFIKEVSEEEHRELFDKLVNINQEGILYYMKKEDDSKEPIPADVLQKWIGLVWGQTLADSKLGNLVDVIREAGTNEFLMPVRPFEVIHN